MTDKTTLPTEATTPAPDCLRLTQKPDQTEQQAMTEEALNAAVSNAVTTAAFLRPSWPSVGVTEAAEVLLAKASAVHGGDLREAETVLIAQATTLNTLFLELTRRAGLNMGANLQATDTYMKLALKAQNQSRMTLETLAAIKNPPVVYARQANFANGNQLVNNGVPMQPASHAAKAEVIQNELEHSDGQRLDIGSAATPSTTHSHCEALGALNRAPNPRGQGKRLSKRVQGQSAPT